MLHVCLDKMPGSESTAERELTGQNSGSDNASQPPGVLSWAGGMRATDAEKVKHRTLGVEDGAAAKSADFDGRHGDGYLQRPTQARDRVVSILCIHNNKIRPKLTSS